MARIVRLADTPDLPFWRRPVALLFVVAIAMSVAFATWSALLNNFVIAAAGFDGADIGLLHTIREIPGLLAIGVIALLIFVREQVLGLIALAAAMAAASFLLALLIPRHPEPGNETIFARLQPILAE